MALHGMIVWFDQQAIPVPQPASSAGVERVFSAAGKMHDDLRKAMTNKTLDEHYLFASFNTP